ncbi:adenosine deaminase family protein [Salinispira pacifica]|uniref:adenosine deaminase n=1 Tax=Salinispira pacifica TaxID=1307761 RepID=V5WH91_9SPIO|nr:adenosine deaminase family protein [Salinispira pacifica]AHC14990.1 Adenosine deaminase [Salinispira pacifica]
MKWYNNEFLRAIPKTDVHVHLDGSLRLSTLIELAQDKHIELPAYTEQGLIDTVFKTSYGNLNEYLAGFAYTTRVMDDPESLERIAYELAEDNILEGVRYLEVRFAPQLHIRPGMGFREVMEAVDRGLRRKRDEFNAALTGDEPEFEYGMIVCAMRFFNEHFSPYFADLVHAHPYSSEREIIQYASLELARAAVQLRGESDIQIVAFDLAGSEYGYPASAHQASYDHVHKNFLNKTVHAGEAYGPESIFQAITDLHADRIGHGLHLFHEHMIHDEKIRDRPGYLHGLQQIIADKRITLEVCLSSNLQTSPEIPSVGQHPLGQMLDKKLSVTLCTDNRLVSHTTVTNEIALALDNFSITPGQLKDMIIYGFKRSFYYRDYGNKRSYVRKIINYYEKMEKEFAIQDP